MDITPGVKLASYEIRQRLGTGGMGEVWRAHDTRLKRDVAVKLLPAELDRDPVRVLRFKREGEVLASLNHPNIATVYGFEEVDGLSFLVLELVEGETLAERLKRGPLSSDTTLQIGKQICQALAAAHEKHILHRDLKPSNVMITRSGSVKLLDFGLAKAFEQDDASLNYRDSPTALSIAGDRRGIIGTPAYMSPEQLRGAALDGRTDFFSFGAVLFEMLTARQLFAGESVADIFSAVLTKELPGNSELPQIQPALLEILRRALAKSKESRYSSAGDLIADLYRIAAPPAAASVADARPSVVVLPFSNVSSDPENEYFCDGLADDLINALTKLDGLSVVGRTSAFCFKRTAADAREVGRRLNVAAVLSGSARRAGERLRVTAQLIDVSNGYQIWSEQFDRRMDDVFDVQDEMTDAIVGALQQRWLSHSARPHLAQYRGSTDAYHLYLKGMFHLYKMTPDAAVKAIDCFQQALAIDPNYAMAYAHLAAAYAFMGVFFVRPTDVMPKAKAAALKALALDETAAGAHGVLGLVKLLYEWEWTDAERELKLRDRTNRRAFEILGCTCHLMESLGRLGDAMDEVHYHLESDPLSIALITELGCVSYYQRRYDQAIQRAQDAIEMAPESHVPYWIAARAYGQKEMYEEAIRMLNKALQISEICPAFILSELGYVQGRAGRQNEAEELIQRLTDLSRRFYVDSFFIGVVCLGLNDIERASDYFEDACDARSGLILSLKSDPKFEKHLHHPRIAALLSRIGMA